VACSEGFPELWGNVKLILLAFPMTYFADKVFCQELHTRKKYGNRLDMNKTGGNALAISQGLR